MATLEAAVLYGVQRKCAGIYSRGDAFLVHASSRTTTGMWLDSPPYLKLDATCTDEELGTAVERALAASIGGLPHPAPSDFSMLEPLLRLTGVKTWKALSKGALRVEVEASDDGHCRLVPTKNLGAGKGFEHQSGVAIALDAPAPGDLGQAIRRALAIST